ncbi:MAG: chorismate lyase [Moraxellaceae bacterium]|nr:chorismate lyase [Moraxellaceae bacterium]
MPALPAGGILAPLSAETASLMPVWNPPHHWFSPAQHWRLRAPAATASWLLETGSLTTRLIGIAQGDFRVRVLAQYWGRPAPEEVRRLGLHPGRYALIREVELLGRGEPWVRARSVLPVGSLTGAGRRLRRLGNRSLGHLLFRDPTLRRGPIEITRLQQPEGPVFARRSHLVYHGQPLLVAECFLPALLAEPPSMETAPQPQRAKTARGSTSPEQA